MGVSLVVGNLDARARDHLPQAALRQRPVSLISGNVEQHVPVRFVRVTLFDQRLDHRDHVRDMLGRTWFDVRRHNAQRGHVLVVDPHELLGDFANRPARLDRRCVDFVVDVGEVTREFQFVAAAQHARQQIEDHGRPRIADVRIVVNRGAAQVHRHVAVYEGLEGDFSSQSGIVELDRHSSSVRPEVSRLLWSKGANDSNIAEFGRPL